MENLHSENYIYIYIDDFSYNIFFIFDDVCAES